MEAASSLAVNDCTITGGEPTLRKDLGNIVSTIRPHCSRITLISNGYRLANHKEAISHIDELHVSYHSMNYDEWERITKVRRGPERVAQNLRDARAANPNIRIKLNVVAENENSRPDQVVRYIELARSIQAEINVFKEGYFSFLSEFGVRHSHEGQAAELWSIDELGGVLVGQTVRKRTYDVDGVRVALSHTSTDKPSWDSCWITPMATPSLTPNSAALS